MTSDSSYLVASADDHQSWSPPALLLGLCLATVHAPVAAVGPEEAKSLQIAEEEARRLARTMTPARLPATGSISFPDAESVSIQFRATTMEPAGPPDLDAYPDLKRSAASGDAASARTVAGVLLYCGTLRRLPVSTEPPFAPFPLSPPARPVQEPDTPAKRRVRDFCDQRSPEEIQSSTALFRQAAAAGDVPAMMRLAEVRTGTQEAVDILDGMWKQGNFIALSGLSSEFGRRAKLAGPESEEAIQALATRWLYTKVYEASFSEHPVPSEFIAALNKSLAARLERASSSVRSAAITRARRMLAENPRCCAILVAADRPAQSDARMEASPLPNSSDPE